MTLNTINQKKYLASYLVAAKQAWRDLFRNTLSVSNSIWLTLQEGDPYPFIWVPKDAERILYVAETDRCGDIRPIFYNNLLNIIPKPKQKKCGCESCQCGGLCEDLNQVNFTTKILFTINGVDYVEKTWMKYCPNGDIIEYREVPVKKYNSSAGDGGDFNNDYNDDYSTGHPGLSDFDIITETFQKKLCSLDVLPCGCPKEIPENEEKVQCFCGCFLPFFGHRRKEHCEHFLRDTNRSEFGEVKISDCQTKIYYKPSSHCHHHHKGRKMPEFLQLSYQTNGDPAVLNQQIQVPEYAKVAMWAGTHYYIRAFNAKYLYSEKQSAKWQFNDATNDVIRFLNPINLQKLADVQDLQVLW